MERDSASPASMETSTPRTRRKRGAALPPPRRRRPLRSKMQPLASSPHRPHHPQASTERRLLSHRTYRTAFLRPHTLPSSKLSLLATVPSSNQALAKLSHADPRDVPAPEMPLVGMVDLKLRLGLTGRSRLMSNPSLHRPSRSRSLTSRDPTKMNTYPSPGTPELLLRSTRQAPTPRRSMISTAQLSARK